MNLKLLSGTVLINKGMKSFKGARWSTNEPLDLPLTLT